MTSAQWNETSIIVLLLTVVLRLVSVGGYGRGAPMWATFWVPTLGFLMLVIRILVSRVADVSPLDWPATVVFFGVGGTQLVAIVAAWWPRTPPPVRLERD